MARILLPQTKDGDARIVYLTELASRVIKSQWSEDVKPASSTLCFAKRCMAVLPPGLAQALGPVLQQIAAMTVKIKQYDRTIKRLTETEYPETPELASQGRCGTVVALPGTSPGLSYNLQESLSYWLTGL